MVRRHILGIFLGVASAMLATGCSQIVDAYNDLFEQITQKSPSGSKALRAWRCQPVKNEDMTHVVRKNETLSEIAQCYKTQWYDIANRNRIQDPKQLQVGQKLIIPSRNWSKTREVQADAKEAKAAQRARLPYVKPPTRKQSGINWCWPTQGKVTRKFNPKGAGKKGIAIGGKIGQHVLSSAAGEVVYSGEGLTGYGKLIIVQHKRDFLTAYAHNDALLVREGDRVAVGQVIAYMGKTAAKSPQLHFEVRYKGNPVNPLKYLPKR